MNREQRRAEQNAKTQKTKRLPQTKAVAKAPSRRPFALWMVGVFVSFGALFGLWKISVASDATATAQPIPVASVLAIDAPRSFAPNFAAPAVNLTDISPTNNGSFVKAEDLKQGDKVWRNGQWQTVASVERTVATATPQPTPSPKPVLEADIDFDLSQSNGGKPFDLGRLAPCSEKVARTNGATTTVGELKAGDTVRLTGGNVRRVVSIKKKWHTPTPPKTDENGNSFNRVIATTKRMTDRLLYLYTSVELVKTTPDHPFAVKSKGFVAAGRLQHGDALETQDGKAVTVERTEVHNEPQYVYNLEVENAHNFFVGKNAMLVHNGGDCVPGMNLEEVMGESGLTPTQKEVWAESVNEYADSMRGGTWDWARTASDPRNPMIKDTAGNILAGHHRFIAAEAAKVKIPDGVVKVIPGSGARVPRPWGAVTVRPGFKP